MAICKKCENTYFSKECPFCKNKKDKEIEELKKIEELREKQKNIMRKAGGLKINYANTGTVNTEYRRKTYKKTLENRIKDKNYLHDLENRYKKGKQFKITTKKEREIDYKFIIISGLIIILILVIIIK